MLADYRRFAQLLSSGRFDLVHVNTSLGIGGVLRDALFILLAKRKKYRVVLFVRGWSPAFERRIGRVAQFLLRHTLGRADKVIVLSSEFADAAELMARALGMPDYAFALIEHPVSSANEAGLNARAQITIDAIRSIVLRPE